jgi:lipopolysaccharide transport system permease protein
MTFNGKKMSTHASSAVAEKIAVIGFLTGPFNALGRYRSLTIELSKREILGRYRGASFGLLWSLISPFLMLMVYTFAFGSVMKARWPQEAGGGHSFAIILFVGLIVHGFFSECFTRAPTLITGNVSYVKRVVFPLDILPWQIMLSALFHAGMNLIVFALLVMTIEGSVGWTFFLTPFVFMPLIFISLGLSWIFSALGVYLRDISQVTGVLSTAALFMSSALVPVKTLPTNYQAVFALNPLTFIIDQARAVMLSNQLPDWLGLLRYSIGGLVFMYVGYLLFSATRRGFADVL